MALQQRAAHQASFRSRGEPTSNRLRGTYDQIRRLRARAKRRHLDWQHKTTTELADTFGVVVVEALPVANMTRRAKPAADPEHPGSVPAQRSGGKVGPQPSDQSRGLGTHHRAACLQDRPTRWNLLPGARTKDVAALLGMWHHHTGQPGKPGDVRMQEPRLRVVGQRRHQRRPKHLASVPDGPRARPGCRKEQSSGAATRQAHHRKVGGNLPPFTEERTSRVSTGLRRGPVRTLT